MKSLLSGKILWSYDHEVAQRSLIRDFSSLFLGVPPLHAHEGEIRLTNTGLFITGDTELQIPLVELKQVSLGFDDVFNRILVKDGGLFWQPLRISFNEQNIYAIIDHSLFGAKNQLWFDTLKRMLSE